MPEDPRRTLGRLGEDLARAHLERRGYEILETNYRTRFGELDIVARDRRTLVFCEVKARRAGGWPPFESIHPRKRIQVRKMAREWMSSATRTGALPELRFDAIGVVVDGLGRLVALDHLEGAF